MRKTLFVQALTVALLIAMSGIAFAEATVEIFEPGIIERETPTGLCLRSHHDSDWDETAPDPGDGDPVGVFTDFAAGEGHLDLGLITPSQEFNGQSHHPCDP